MRLLFIISIMITAHVSVAQNRNSVWVFGDSSGIDFGSGGALPIVSAMDGRGSCASISDINGELLFYAATMPEYFGPAGVETFVFNQNHNVMQYGDSIVGRGWYQELVIIPSPAKDSMYYLFSISVTENYGLVYSIIDMRLNAGLGAVTQKNIQLQNFQQVDCINAVKHGNGRDWWVIFRMSGFPAFNNDFYTYLITPAGIQNVSIQSFGEQNVTNLGKITISPEGTKMIFINLNGVIELFNFDRCTGLLSNSIPIDFGVLAPPEPFYWSCEFSPDASKMFISTNSDTSYLFQYDLNAPNISASKDTLFSISNIEYALGALKRGPDEKIYLSGWYNDGFNAPYPYADSVYNMYNMNLSVINQPNNLGTLCDFQPYSFNLGGKRTYLGLPNNPEYDLQALAGSPCDTLVGIGDAPQIQQAALNVFYHTAWEKAFINASNLLGKTGKLLVYDMQGKIVHSEPLRIQNGYYTRDLSMIGKAHGVYLIVLETEQELLVKKMLIE
ncbi:MAG: T9SS type A sorting domain-containing protein [Bacteroidetes bacterium]|nr:T9SS type A sorting domain-containing protein [Bacteroidota bacterium]